jgi:hypothetical protein
MKLIAACIVNNAANTLEETLYGIAQRIADVDAFVIQQNIILIIIGQMISTHVVSVGN